MTGRRRVRQPIVTLAIGILFLLQLLGTFGGLPWTPGLFVGGGLDRLVVFAAENGFEALRFIQFLTDVAISGFWAFMLIASSGLGADVPPKILPGERGWQFDQKRIAYAGPLILLLSGHAIGHTLAAAGLWPLAIPFELGGHLGMASLLYVLLIPEGRRRLVIIEDVRRGGVASRIHLSSGFYARTKGRRWLAIRHDQLRGAELNDPLWARLFDSAHVELTYIDNNWQVCRQVAKCIGTKEEVAAIISFLNGSFLARRPPIYGQPIVRIDPSRQPIYQDEESAPF